MSGGLGFNSGNSSAQSSQTSNSTNTSTPPPAIEGILKTLSQNLTNDYLQNPNAPAYYPGSTVAAQSPMTQSALQTLFQAGANGWQGLQPFRQNLTDIANGSQLNLASNPYFQGAISYAQQPVIQAFNSQVLPGITGSFEGAGRTPESGNLAGGAVGLATDALTRNIAGAATTAGNQAFLQGEQNQLTADGLYPQLQNAQYQNIGAMEQAGQAQDAYDQALTDANVARYNYNQTAEPNYIANIAQLLQAIYPGAQTTGNSSASGYSTQASNGFGAQLNVPFVSDSQSSKSSDRRLKTDIRPVGKLHDGQTVYSYRFRGNPRTEIGLLAQEVEKRRPEAVSRHLSGFKMVDYRKATMTTGRRQRMPQGMPQGMPKGGLL